MRRKTDKQKGLVILKTLFQAYAVFGECTSMNGEKLIMALDQGTTSSRCILFDRRGTIKSINQKQFEQIYPQPGWVEHDPVAIWSTQIGVAAEACAQLGVSAEDIAAIGITNQRETTVVWDKNTGKPVYNAIVWQCRRTSSMIEAIDDEMKLLIREHTGLIPDAYFSASKIKWILDNVPGAGARADAGDLLFGTIDTWLMWNLSGRKIHATDYTNASRTMLFNIRTLEWDDEILGYFGIPKSMMPEVHPSGYMFGESNPAFFGVPVPVCGVCGDQQSSLFGQCCFDEGDVKNTYGTGCFLLMNTGSEIIRSRNGLLTTVAACPDGERPQYALEGSIYVGGAVIQWLRDEMGILDNSPQSEEFALKVKDTAGAYLVPAFTGLGAPYWDQDARGTLTGVTRGFNKYHLTRAALESIAYQTSDVIRAMEADAGVPMTSLKVDGGASSNNFLMQFQADITGARIVRPAMVENTALGAAYLAGLTCGYWNSKEELRENCGTGSVFLPQMEENIRQEKLSGWERAVRTACQRSGK